LFLAGRASGFWLLVAIAVAILWQIQRAKVKLPEIKRVPALDAVDEIIGRCVEMGRPVHVTPGLGALSGTAAPATLAGLECVSYVAKQAATMGAKLITTVGVTEIFPVAEAMVSQAFRDAGRPDAYNSDMVRYLPGDEQFAYAAAVMAMYEREEVKGNIIVGQFAGEALLLVEAGHNAGAMQVGGTVNSLQAPFFVAACDYFLVGEEILTVGAYLSRDPVRMGSTVGQDMGKLIFMGLILVGVIMRALGANVIGDWLSK
jgi:hypothetical protein